jgi:hypothetical protein
MMIQEQPPAELIAAVDAVGTAPQASTSERLPCPICFETPIDIFSYVEVQTHSWANYDRCDAHGMCRSCVQRYVEVKLLDEGIWMSDVLGKNVATISWTATLIWL